jgi:hypothetical protein
MLQILLIPCAFQIIILTPLSDIRINNQHLTLMKNHAILRPIWFAYCEML